MNEFEILGVKISDTTTKEILESIDNAIEKNHKIQICTTNNEFIIDAQKNPKFRKIINSCNISTADSFGVVWAVQKLFNRKIDRIPGVDLFESICKVMPNKNFRIFLLGGSKNIALKTKKILQKKYIGIHIVGCMDGIEINPDKRDDELIAEINKAKPDIVAVALGAPKQELWIANNMEYIKANVFIGLGGTFDYVSGKVARAPIAIRKLGLEWLFRLFTNPRRAIRIFKAVIVFPLLITFSRK